jgi:hypothetical protein
MLADTYGMMFNENTVIRERAPPENMSKTPRIPLAWFLVNSETTAGFTFGNGM